MLDNHTDSDTNSLLQRYVRGVDQYKFEKKSLPTLNGANWKERWTTIRNALFKQHNQENLISLTTPRETEIKDYPNPKLVDELYRPALERFTDGVEANLPNEAQQSEKGFRLAVVNYVLGILMHPSLDGNGQTFRLLALSYIHEHCPEFSDKYLPIKYTADPSETKIRGWDEARLHKVKMGYPNIEQMSEEDQKLLECFHETCGIGLKVMREGNDVSSDHLGDWREKRTNELVNNIMAKVGVTMEQVMPKGIYLPDVALAKYIGTILAERYPGYSFEMYPDKKHEKMYLLTASLTTPSGLHALRSFIDTGSCGIEGENLDPENNALMILDGFLSVTEKQLKEVMSAETAIKHDTRHQRQVIKRMM